METEQHSMRSHVVWSCNSTANEQSPFTARWLQHQQKQQHSSWKQTTTQSIKATCNNRQKLKTVDNFLNPTQNERNKETKKEWMNELRNATTYLLTYLLADKLTALRNCRAADLSWSPHCTAHLQKETKLQQPPTGSTFPSWTVRARFLFFFRSFSWITSHTPRLQITWVLRHHKTQTQGNIKSCRAKDWRRVRVVEL